MRRSPTDAESAVAEGELQPTRLFADRNFAIYWSGGLISNIGTWLQNVTASVIVLQISHSPFLVGVLNFATFAPVLLLSIAGGMLSDRFDRRRIVIVTQTFSAAVATLLTVVSGTGRMTVGLLIVLAFLLGSSYALAKPSVSALLPSLVERRDLARATAVNTLQFNIGQVAGSLLSAVLLTFAGPTWAFGVNALSYAAPVASMLLLRIPRSSGSTKRKGVRGTGMEGLRFLRTAPGVLALLGAVVLSNASVEALRTLAPDLASRVLDVGGNAAGLLVTAYSLGATVGLLGFGWVSRRFSPRPLLTAAFVLQGVGVLGVAVAPNLAVAAVAAAPIGLGFALNIPVLSAGLQQSSPEEYLGRTMSAFSMCHLGLRPVFSLAVGGLASLLDSRIAMALFAVFPLLALRLVAATGTAVSNAREEAG